jgi:hypothetical protein
MLEIANGAIYNMQFINESVFDIGKDIIFL